METHPATLDRGAAAELLATIDAESEEDGQS
jgi:hypothetical protein